VTRHHVLRCVSPGCLTAILKASVILGHMGETLRLHALAGWTALPTDKHRSDVESIFSSET